MSRCDRTISVAASDSDITTASVRAMVDSLDRLLAGEETPVLADD